MFLHMPLLILIRNIMPESCLRAAICKLACMLVYVRIMFERFCEYACMYAFANSNIIPQ
jgi:hypothetical protein